MKPIFLFALLLPVVINSSCFHFHLRKIPAKYVNSVSNKVNYLAPAILNIYTSNTSISVTEIADIKLKNDLRQLKIDYIRVTYKFDTVGKLSYLKNFKPTEADSCIDFNCGGNRLKIDNWQTENTVRYFFGTTKPDIKNSKDEFSNLNRKINDSVYFFRAHWPPGR